MNILIKGWNSRGRRRWLARLCVAGTIGILACSVPSFGAQPTVLPPARAAERTTSLPPRPTAPLALSAVASPVPLSRPGTVAEGPAAPVRVGLLDALSDSGLTIGQARGFFAEQRLNISPTHYPTADTLLSALVTGQVDAACLPITADLFLALSKGAAIRLTAEASGAPIGHGGAGLAIRSDLWPDIKDPADLRGMRVGLLLRGSSLEVELAALLRQGRLARTDLETIVLSADRIVSGLADGSLEAAMVPEPLLGQIEQDGVGRAWRRSDRILPNHLTAALIFTSSFGQDRPQTARRFATAYLKAIRLYNDAFVKNLGPARIVSSTVLAQGGLVLAPDAFRWLVPPGINPNGMVNLPSLRQDQQYFRQIGLLSREVDLPPFVDARYAAYAILQLGEYR
jgi:NitT/TauT family transport system substrate-binding protein